MDRIWVTGDLHLRHGNIMKYCSRVEFMTELERNTFEYIKDNLPDDRRAMQEVHIGLDSIRRMDNGIIDNINALVGVNDTLHIMGDIIFLKDITPANRLAKLKEYIDRIRCRNIHFIIGNHDYFKKKDYQQLFSSVHYYLELKVNHQKFILSHYPFLEWNGKFRGSICLHGHCHTNIEDWKSEHIPNAALIDIGVDAWDYKPVNLRTLYNKAQEIVKR
jgi:calcineurin-like phosphoesterase family protein